MGVSGDGKKTLCGSTQGKHSKTALDQTIGIDVSRDLCDHPLMTQVGGGKWSQKKFAKRTLTYFL